MHEKPNAEFYRKMLRSFPWVNDLEGETHRRFVEDLYRELKSGSHKGPKDDIFLPAVDLFIFGKLDVYEDIIDNLGPRHIHFQMLLSYSTKYLVPLPDELDPYDNPEAVKQWFRENRDRLRWDEEVGRFVWVEAQ